MDQFTLENFSHLLETEGLNFYTGETKEDKPFSRVCVFMGRDGRGRERILEINIKEQLLAYDQNEYSHLVLEYVFQFPFPVKDIAVSDLGRYLAFLNRASDLPGFEMDEIANSALYRHVLIADRNFQDPKHIIAIIGLIRLYLDLFTEDIERIAKGSMTANEMIEEALTRISQK